MCSRRGPVLRTYDDCDLTFAGGKWVILGPAGSEQGRERHAELVALWAASRPARPKRKSRPGEPRPERAPRPKAADPGAGCRHCEQALVNRPRGLCHSCYCHPAVRPLYGSTSRHARRGCGLAEARGESTPTAALPGSLKKIAILAARAAAGLKLWHEQDA